MAAVVILAIGAVVWFACVKGGAALARWQHGPLAVVNCPACMTLQQVGRGAGRWTCPKCKATLENFTNLPENTRVIS
jgi:hypothetical protein